MMMDSAADLANGKDGPTSPALHHHHAEHVARDVNHHTRTQYGLDIDSIYCAGGR